MIRHLCAQAGVKISGLSSHSDLLNPEWGVLYARRGIRYARALGVNIVQITEDMYPPKWVDERLLWRLGRELAFRPAFHESLDTVKGRPHGHHLYRWNSGFWWLRREVRKRLNLSDPDQLDTQLDEELGVSRQNGYLQLLPDTARLRPNCVNASIRYFAPSTPTLKCQL